MTTQTNPLVDLAERVEAATGSDRELDFAIYATLNSEKDCSGIKRSQRYLYGEPYTASLDAAMTLVPEGWQVKIWSTGHVEIYKLGEVVEFKDGSKIRPYACGGSPINVGPTATPALALTAAALRALSQHNEEKG